MAVHEHGSLCSARSLELFPYDKLLVETPYYSRVGVVAVCQGSVTQQLAHPPNKKNTHKKKQKRKSIEFEEQHKIDQTTSQQRLALLVTIL